MDSTNRTLARLSRSDQSGLAAKAMAVAALALVCSSAAIAQSAPAGNGPSGPSTPLVLPAAPRGLGDLGRLRPTPPMSAQERERLAGLTRPPVGLKAIRATRQGVPGMHVEAPQPSGLRGPWKAPHIVNTSAAASTPKGAGSGR